ncbi:hypothetical protein GCM10010317_023270 [Streptomyces mirabilis]|nr:hypothetical protein GCM10010317_023270 [Streptomyces mirabilis]
MYAPVSARIISAERVLTPGMVVSSSIWRRNGELAGDLLTQPGLGRGDRVDAVEHGPREEGVVAGECLGEDLAFGAHAGSCHLGEDLGVTIPGDQGLQHRSGGLAQQVRDDRGQRLARDYETLSVRSEAVIHIAMTDLMARRLTSENAISWRDPTPQTKQQIPG